MANAGCINAIGFDGCFLRTLQCLDSSNIGVGVQYTAPNPLDDKRFDYITYTDKCGCQCCLTDENEILIYATQGVIKNLTLTNDDTNEKVIVKRTDLFGSNRAKTVVRYKTGSYPSSPTDGTLAVEETTQNQYSVSGYNVSGLTDGTTYYFTAFAVSQDGTTIIVQNKSITTDFGRKPSSNTIAYYQFNGNLNDSSGNNRNLSMYTGSFSYGTTTGGAKYVQTSSSNTANNYTLPLNSTAYTVSCFVNFGEIRYSGAQAILMDFTGNNGRPRFRSGVGGILPTCGVGAQEQWYSGTANTWYLFTIVFNNHTAYGYINGQLRTSGAMTQYSSTTGLLVLNGIDDKSRTQYRASGKMSELIFETKARSQSDITKYLNKMKSKYGIS